MQAPRVHLPAHVGELLLRSRPHTARARVAVLPDHLAAVVVDAEEIERRGEALVDANRQVRVLETLRQKQLDRHRQGENRQEIKQLDETAGRRTPKEDDA